MTFGSSSKAVAADRRVRSCATAYSGRLGKPDKPASHSRDGKPCSSAHEFGSKVVVAGGDTSTVLRDAIGMRVRLDGIGCPENSQAISFVAGFYLQTHLRQGGRGSAAALAAGYRAGKDCHS